MDLYKENIKEIEMENKVYIENNNSSEAFQEYYEMLQFDVSRRTEIINTADALGRMTVKPIYAKTSDPCFNASAMDGIAVIASEIETAGDMTPLVLSQADYCYVNTGDVVHAPFDSVIMIEDVTRLEDGSVKIITPSHPWQHVRMVGESVVQEEMLLTSNHKIRPMDMGALLSGGVDQIEVYQKITVGIIPTGAELVSTPAELEVGKLMEYNSKVFSGLCCECGAKPIIYPIVKGELEELTAAVAKACDENDIVIINAGSSAGTRDFSAKAIEELGRVHTHGLAIKPGKPTILGSIGVKPVIGIPGYPVSAYLVFDRFVRPFLENKKRESLEAKLTRRIVSNLKFCEFVRVTLAKIEGEYLATPLERGAASIMSLVKADGLVMIARNKEGVELGESVQVELMRPRGEIDETLVFIGSHDLLLDEVSDIMPIKSTHVGSMGGIMAIKRGLCHIAPIHVLDEVEGTYNEEIVKQLLSDEYVIIKGVSRVQGFITRENTEVTGLDDIIEKNLSFANRQRGSGTRILLDYHLKQKGIDGKKIYGYDKEYSTHMAVAAAVQSKSADLGIGVYSAAKALGLTFIPFKNEEYDFVVKRSNLELEQVKKFIQTIKSERFKQVLGRLGGYETNHVGEVYDR